VTDRLIEAARGAIYVLGWNIQMMRSGWLKTSNEGHDTTNESISQLMAVVKDLEDALPDQQSVGS
jgi:hypothetical protein